MAKTLSTMLPLGTLAPEFNLADPAGRLWSLSEVAGANGLLVIFLCNHCPYVQHVAAELAKLGADLQRRALGVIGINPNDIEAYPEDRPELMALESKARGYTFPYVLDATQSVASAYQAACTPDFFLFRSDRRLVYRGQLDAARPGNGVPVTGTDLRQAVAAMLAGSPAPEPQLPSLGCGIKWRSARPSPPNRS